MEHIEAIDAILDEQTEGSDPPPFILSLEVVQSIIDHISASLLADEGHEWDVRAYKATLEHLANSNPVTSQRGEVACLIRKGRNLAKFSPSGKLQNAPDSKNERTAMENFQGSRPAFLLYRQNGKAEQLWSGCPFWWPVLRAPANTPTVIFAADTVE